MVSSLGEILSKSNRLAHLFLVSIAYSTFVDYISPKYRTFNFSVWEFNLVCTLSKSSWTFFLFSRVGVNKLFWSKELNFWNEELNKPFGAFWKLNFYPLLYFASTHFLNVSSSMIPKVKNVSITWKVFSSSFRRFSREHMSGFGGSMALCKSIIYKYIDLMIPYLVQII